MTISRMMVLWAICLVFSGILAAVMDIEEGDAGYENVLVLLVTTIGFLFHFWIKLMDEPGFSNAFCKDSKLTPTSLTLWIVDLLIIITPFVVIMWPLSIDTYVIGTCLLIILGMIFSIIEDYNKKPKKAKKK